MAEAPSPLAVIFGRGGHARVIASFLHGRYDEMLFVTPDGAEGDLAENAMDAWFPAHAEADFYLGIGANAPRRRVLEALSARGASLPPAVAPNAYVSPHAELGRGTFVGAGASVVANARMAEGAIVNTNSAIDHDCVLGANAQITVGVAVGGTCRFGADSFVGAGATIIPGIEIGEGAVVMAGSVVTRPVEPGTMVGGVPSRLVRRL